MPGGGLLATLALRATALALLVSTLAGAALLPLALRVAGLGRSPPLRGPLLGRSRFSPAPVRRSRVGARNLPLAAATSAAASPAAARTR
ncbi:MAG TPA: hypothetical protein VNP95_09220 [Thermomicrobiales bacterium]|nr:hypothetical protein [Thermomicrobiales bacterium]